MRNGGNDRLRPQQDLVFPRHPPTLLDSNSVIPDGAMAGDYRQATPILSLTNATPLVSTLLKYQNQHNVGNGDAMFATQNRTPFSRHKV